MEIIYRSNHIADGSRFEREAKKRQVIKNGLTNLVNKLEIDKLETQEAQKIQDGLSELRAELAEV